MLELTKMDLIIFEVTKVSFLFEPNNQHFQWIKLFSIRSVNGNHSSWVTKNNPVHQINEEVEHTPKKKQELNNKEHESNRKKKATSIDFVIEKKNVRLQFQYRFINARMPHDYVNAFSKCFSSYSICVLIVRSHSYNWDSILSMS